MSDSTDSEICELCGQGKIVRRNEPMSFQQWTDRGHVFCHVTIPMGICSHCGNKSWDEAAEAIIDQAVRDAYEKLQ